MKWRGSRQSKQGGVLPKILVEFVCDMATHLSMFDVEFGDAFGENNSEEHLKGYPSSFKE